MESENKTRKIEALKGRLIVSCQALPNEPLHSSFIMGRMAKAAKEGGAFGIRAKTKEDIAEIQKQVDLPIIGIVKRDYDDCAVYITPTIAEVDELMEQEFLFDVSDVQEQIRKEAVKVYKAIGCHGLSRVDFFATYAENRVVFNEINTLPGFTSISMYPKLFAASGVSYSQLIDNLLALAMEAF